MKLSKNKQILNYLSTVTTWNKPATFSLSFTYSKHILQNNSLYPKHSCVRTPYTLKMGLYYNYLKKQCSIMLCYGEVLKFF